MNALPAGRERLFTVNVCRTSRFMSSLGGGSGVAAILEDEDAEHEPTEVRQREVLRLGGAEMGPCEGQAAADGRC